MMDVVFRMWTDSGAWLEHAGGGDGSVGSPVVRPSGLLETLETAHGLGSLSTTNVVRIAAFQAGLVRIEGSPRFWSRSLEVDGWATARTLLRWREELVDAGWDAGHAWASPRLADLAAAKAAAHGLPAGLADRAAVMAAALESGPSLPIRRIRLIDARANHSAGWRRLFLRLEECGVLIEEIAPTASAPDSTALGRLQRWMNKGEKLDGKPDGTVTIATSASEALAAELAGHWFAERGDRGAILIARDADTHLLDHGLCGAGQPRAGRRWGAPEVAPTNLVAAADLLHKFLDERFAGAARLREWPVHAAEELQFISGRIDLLLDDGGDFAIIDRKSFPGAMQLDDERLREFAGQVHLYARALRRGTGRGCREYWIHQLIAGVALRVEFAETLAA